MPCRSYEDDIPNNGDIAREKEENNLLTAMLCALTTELVKTNNGQIIISQAETNSGINIRKWIDDHKKEDIERLEKKLGRLSNHELELLKTIIKNRNV